MNKLWAIVILLIVATFSCGAPTGGSTAEDVQDALPDITTKIVNGRTIPDEILGFRIGMTRDEVHQVAAKRGMRKNTWLSSGNALIFNGIQLLGLETKRISLRFENETLKEVRAILKKADQATFNRTIEKLTEHFKTPAPTTERDPRMTGRKWSYGSSHYLYAKLDISSPDPDSYLLYFSYTQ